MKAAIVTIGDEILNDFELIVFKTPLDNTRKIFKKEPWSKSLSTEKEVYDYIELQLKNYQRRIDTIRNELLEIIKELNYELEEDSFSCLFKSTLGVISKNYNVAIENGNESAIKYWKNWYDNTKRIISECCKVFTDMKQRKTQRMHFIYNLESKEKVAKFAADKLRQKNKRFIMMCSNKKQSKSTETMNLNPSTISTPQPLYYLNSSTISLPELPSLKNQPPLTHPQ